jgi:cell division protein ZapB
MLAATASHRIIAGMAATLHELAQRIDRLLVRHEEQARTNELLAKQLQAVTSERDNLKSRLSAARSRIDALLERLPADGASGANGNSAAEDPTP